MPFMPWMYASPSSPPLVLIGQLAAERQALDRREVLRLAAAAEAELLELHEHERREVVVEERGRDVGRA